MDLNARVKVNCGLKDGRTENQTPISHLAKAGATKKYEGVPIHLISLYFCSLSNHVILTKFIMELKLTSEFNLLKFYAQFKSHNINQLLQLCSGTIC